MNPLLHFIQHGRAEGRRPPPVLLLPAQSTMIDPPDEGAFDATLLTAAEPTIRLIESWMGKLLDRIAASAPVDRAKP